MTETEVIEICRESILVMLWVAGPIMFMTLVVGLVLSLFQALTQIQEQTLTFIPKMLLVFGSSIFLMPYMLGQMTTFTHMIADKIIALGAG
ncbi:Flagellar biosynthetic protein FliQ [Azospirillaceae bacterium]